MMGYSRSAALSSEPGAGQEVRAKALEVGGQHRRHTRRGSLYLCKNDPFYYYAAKVKWKRRPIMC